MLAPFSKNTTLQLNFGPVLGYKPVRSAEEFVYECKYDEITHVQRYGAAAIPVLREIINRDGPWRFNELYIRALGYVGDASVVDDLLRLLEDAAPLVKPEIIKTLGKIGDQRAVPALRDLLQQAIEDGQNITEKAAIVVALGQIGGSLAVDTLRNALESGSKNAYLEVIPALGQAAGVGEMIAILTTHENGDVRAKAAQVLGELGDEAAIAPLITSLETDEYKWVTLYALIALGNLQAVDAVEPLLRRWEAGLPDAWTRTIIDALGNIGDPMPIPALNAHLTNTERTIDQLKRGEQSIAYHARAALENIGTPEALATIEAAPGLYEPPLDLLITEMEDADQPHIYFPHILNLLGESSNPAAIEPLNQVLSDMETYALYRETAARALMILGTPEAIAALERAQDSDPDRDVQTMIREGLRKLATHS